MGGGRWDSVVSSNSTRALTNTAVSRGVDYKDVAFAYTNSREFREERKLHPNLDPRRINRKPFNKLESRDSVEHPESNAVLVCFDVTGSNYDRAVEAQQKLPNLMDLLAKYLPDPQVAVAANDDYTVEGRMSLQISDYESDNRVDEHIKNIALVRDGGGNNGESYDLLLYAAARKTVLDCMEVRNKKGYLFMYADEPFFKQVNAEEIKDIFGDKLESDIPIKQIIKEAQKLYNVFIIWPTKGFIQAKEQYDKLFGEENVLSLQDPNMLCELIASVVGINEQKLASNDDVIKDLESVGMSKSDAVKITKTVGGVRRRIKLEVNEATGTGA